MALLRRLGVPLAVVFRGFVTLFVAEEVLLVATRCLALKPNGYGDICFARLRKLQAWRLVRIMTQTPPRQKNKPALFDSKALLEWYDTHARDLPWRVLPQDRALGEVADPYRVWLSEIMLQQTTVVTVKEYFLKFTMMWPSVHDLASAPLDDVLSAWAGLGYYARARNLHAAAQFVSVNLKGVFPTNAQELLTLPGVGPYTAAAVASICFDERVAVVDGNVERVMARQLLLDKPVRDAKPLIKDAVQALVPKRAGDFAQAMMDLGATICTPRVANCEKCPLVGDCAAQELADPTIYPVKAPKKPKPERFGHAFVLANKSGQVWLRKRPEKGLLAKMAEVPGSEWTDTLSAPVYPAPGDWVTTGQVVHVFTHFKLTLTVWHVATDMDVVDVGGWWSGQNEIGGEALPTLFRKVLATKILVS